MAAAVGNQMETVVLEEELGLELEEELNTAHSNVVVAVAAPAACSLELVVVAVVGVAEIL